jgi:hypothetical protein
VEKSFLQIERTKPTLIIECGLCPALNPHGGDQVRVTYRTPRAIATTAINKLKTIKRITPSTGALFMVTFPFLPA